MRVDLAVSSEPSSTSVSLLRRVRRREADAWERLCALYGPLVYGWCRRLGLQDSDAADAVQDVFRAVFRSIGAFQGDGRQGGGEAGRVDQAGSFRVWLWVITRNQVRLHFRRQGNTPQAFGGSDARRRFAEQPQAPDDSADEHALAESHPAEPDAAALEPFAAGANLAALLDNAPAETACDGATGAWDTQPHLASTSRQQTVLPPASPPTAAAGALHHRAGGGSRRRPGVIAAALLGGVILLGVILLTVRGPHGEVIVELGPGVKADDVKIEVRGDGALKIVDADAGWTLDVKEGKYTAQLTGGNDRLQLDREQVTVTRGGKAFVRVTLRPPDVPGSPWRPTAAQQAFFDEVAKLQPAEQLEAVRKKLMEANPGFDGKVTHKTNAGRVVELQFFSDEVAAIWPVRGLGDLKVLLCNRSRSETGGPGKLSDLSPLKGMPLTRLDCEYTRVSDLAPLRGMPLKFLHCNLSAVTDLSPLRGVPLTNLYVRDTRVSDLSPLRGMRLTFLDCGATGVSDLSPLKGMPLRWLSCYSTRVSDLSPLRGMPLITLYCSGTRVSDLSPLRGLPLRRIFIDERLFHAADEALLRSLPLTNINYVEGEWQPASEFWKAFAARRQAAEAFAAETAKLPAEEQVAAVATKLRELNAKVPELESAIEDDAVTSVNLLLKDVTSDVTPLRAFSKLRKLSLGGGPYWLDLSPVNSLPLEELNCTADIALRNAPVLRGIETLKTINGRPAAEYLDSLKPPVADVPGSPSWSPTAEQQAFFDAVALLSAEEQIGVVAARMKAVNPGFDGKLKHRIEERRVVHIDVARAPVRELWPLAALTTLESLDISGVDIDQLPFLARLTNLESLDCRDTWVRDLSPLAGLPLKTLSTFAISVYNEPAVAVLRMMPNLETINGVPIKAFLGRRDELERLRERLPAFTAERQLALVVEKLKEWNPGFDGKLANHTIEARRVTWLSLNDTKSIADLSPLAVLPLTSLHFEHTAVADLSPLKGMKLTHLICGHTRVTDLSPLQGMPLTELFCHGLRVSDLSPLRGMPLTHLRCYNTRVSSLSSLKGMKLTKLYCFGTGVSDLSPLQGMPLTNLHSGRTAIADLSPLKGMPLISLDCGSTRVTDLSPLKGAPLTHLSCDDAGVSDLLPLAEMPLEQIWYDLRLFHAADETLLRSLPLKTINGRYPQGQPAAEFWRAFEARREAAAAFAAETAKLPAEEQAAMVVTKLKELNSGAVGELEPLIENDAVISVTLAVADVTGDVTPLRAFSTLRKLTLGGSPRWLDLSPVNSLPLEELNCTADIALRNAPVLRGIEALKTINGQPAAEYLDSLQAK